MRVCLCVSSGRAARFVLFFRVKMHACACVFGVRSACVCFVLFFDVVAVSVLISCSLGRAARANFSLYIFKQILFITIQQFIHFHSTKSYFFLIYIENHTFYHVLTQRIAHKKSNPFAEKRALRRVRRCDCEVCAPSNKLDFKTWPSQMKLGRRSCCCTCMKFADKLNTAPCKIFKRL